MGTGGSDNNAVVKAEADSYLHVWGKARRRSQQAKAAFMASLKRLGAAK